MALSRKEAFGRFDEIHEAGSIREVLSSFDALAPELGVSGFALFTDATDPIANIETAGSTDFRDHFAGTHLLASFPRTHRLIVAADGPAWELVGSPIDGARRVRRSSDEWHHSGGISVPVNPLPGDPLDVCFLPLGEQRIDDHVWLMILADVLCSSRRRMETTPVGAPSSLSAREFEVLRWMAEGKSAEDVAEIVAISAATVMFHYRNVAMRLGTLNRTHTIVEAMRQGLLPLPNAPPQTDA
jgi:DNA-binding CsgD family transcriptional regulator